MSRSLVDRFNFSEYSTCSAQKNDVTGAYSSFDGAQFTIASTDGNPSDVCMYCLTESISLYKYNPKWFSIQVQSARDPVEGNVYVKLVRILFRAGEKYIDLEPTQAMVSMLSLPYILIHFLDHICNL